ncbi:MAG TPA: MerR family transcriptional regulator [Solirubrobacteraceae bacterium]|nr:MerR family transcriptional regulator [Solirubrobacteraceae bacterium]
MAERVGLPARTVRYYDRIGLVSPQTRSEAGYRLYEPEDEGRLRFVRQAKVIGFSLDEIRELLAAAERGSCGELIPELERLLADKVRQVDARIADLQAFRGRLTAYQAGRGSNCGCRGHGAFCGCLGDVPVSEPKNAALQNTEFDNAKEVANMACQCGCNTTAETTTEPTITEAAGCNCGCNDTTRGGEGCNCGTTSGGEGCSCGSERRDADREPQIA